MEEEETPLLKKPLNATPQHEISQEISKFKSQANRNRRMSEGIFGFVSLH